MSQKHINHCGHLGAIWPGPVLGLCHLSSSLVYGPLVPKLAILHNWRESVRCWSGILTFYVRRFMSVWGSFSRSISTHPHILKKLKIQSILYKVHLIPCTLYSILFILYTLYSILYTLYSTLYTLYSTLQNRYRYCIIFIYILYFMFDAIIILPHYSTHNNLSFILLCPPRSKAANKVFLDD